MCSNLSCLSEVEEKYTKLISLTFVIQWNIMSYKWLREVGQFITSSERRMVGASQNEFV